MTGQIQGNLPAASKSKGERTVDLPNTQKETPFMEKFVAPMAWSGFPRRVRAGRRRENPRGALVED